MATTENKNLSPNSLHVVMFPWLAFGHMIPFLELSKFIAQKGHKITFVSTPKNIARLPKLPPNLTSSINFLSLSLPKVDGLPGDVEATVDLGSHDVSLLKKAFDGLKPELTSFLENSLPEWIVYDFSHYWLPPAADKLGIGKVFFSILSASSLVFFGAFGKPDPRTKLEDFTVPPPWVPFETKVAFKLHESKWMLSCHHEDGSGVSDIQRSGSSASGSDLILVRQCNELEGKWIKLLEEINHKPVLPVGLLPPRMEENAVDYENPSWFPIKEWLDGQESGSVLYVAFGSEVAMSQPELTELALGLELSEVPFFWAIRKSTETIELPEGFEERVKGRGIVWRSWAPQLSILRHDSVGGFLSHCGWSSVIEGLMFGHPIIMLPFVIDTGLVARVLGEKMVGIEIPRDEMDGSYTRESVAESVKLVMVKNEGKIYREKSKEIGEIFGNREIQDGYIDGLVEYLENNGSCQI
ncbi:OLC1v1016045C1 [Oldenlandia corymbosa var. corymbosa]|uniref:OLC1v1016045C1 n=1 Tax=Oldenlandia corymbosa var. corymbosa TaxID=529605 RepID=A0AAV1E4U0_OLDCO|nr:OLC1v1016045C1 [Oldenlandia corymbosa var. corymbosa]